MIRASLLALLLSSAAASALAQDPHAGHAMAAPPAEADPHAAHAAAATPPAANPHAGHAAPIAPDPHAGHSAPAQAADPHAGHTMATPGQDAHADHVMEVSGPPAVAENPTPPPPPPTDHAAERFFSPEAMARSRRNLALEHGGARVSKVMADLFEYQGGAGGDGFRWSVEGWYGGDTHRLVVKSEGEGGDSGVEEAEVQALYSRPIGRYTDLQLGLRHDIEPGPLRTYATVGFETLLPYWFEAEGALFLSEDGDVLGRLEGSYDLRLTQKLILQPRVEVEFAAQDVPELQVGSGATSAEVGLRLRYEVRREFAPYVGVNYDRALGDTAGLSRAAGEDVSSTSVVVGIRAWF